MQTLNRFQLRTWLTLSVPVLMSLGSPALAETTGTLYIATSTVLSENHAGNIVVVADGVTLDCAGHAVAGDGLEIGILLDARTGVTVKNCHVTGFGRAFLLSGGSGNTLLDNTANMNDFGFHLAFSSGNTVIGNTAANNTVSGFAPGDASGNTFESNTANRNGQNGFEIHNNSANNLFIANTANNNASAGFALNTSPNNTFTGNTATNNSSSGFELSVSSNNNTLDENTSSHNGGAGFALGGSSGNTMTDNVVKANEFGFHLLDSDNNVVTENNSCPNMVLDAFQDETSTGNIFEDNIFCTTEGV